TNPMQMFAGTFSVFRPALDLTLTPFFLSEDGGVTWSDFGSLGTFDKSISWKPDGSAVLVAKLGDVPIDTYSVIVTDSGFGSRISTFPGNNNNDQPWIRTGPSNRVYVAYNDPSRTGPGFEGGKGDGKTANVLVSTNGGTSYTSVAVEKVGTTLAD